MWAWLLGAFLATSSVVAALDDHEILVTDSGGLDLNRLLGSSPLRPDRLQKLAAESTDLLDFLSRLKSVAPRMFERPVILHRSGSLQLTTAASPRVLLFGQGAVLALTSEAGQRDVVEILALDDSNSRIVPMEINFSAAERVQLRPTKCIACHGEDTRLLWSTYDTWPNVFGAASGLALDPRERELYDRISAPALRRAWGSSIAFPEKFGAGKVSEANDDFSLYVFSLNLLRGNRHVAQTLERAPEFSHVLAAAWSGCFAEDVRFGLATYRVEEFFPAETLRALPLKFDNLKADTSDKRDEFLAFVQRRSQLLFPGTRHDFEISRRLDSEIDLIAPARLILENLGLAWTELISSSGENRMSMTVPTQLAFELPKLARAQWPALADLPFERLVVPGFDTGWIRFDCESLKVRSLAALRGKSVDPSIALAPPSERALTHGLPPMAKCVYCHSNLNEDFSNSMNSVNAPSIPFEDTEALVGWLRADPRRLAKIEAKLGSGEMPLADTLSAQERSALLEVIRNFAK